MTSSSDQAAGPEEPGWNRRNRLEHALPGLLLALNIVLVALIVTQPWERALHGPVAQVRPENATDELTTGTGVGQLAPNFRLEDIEGNVIELAAMRGGPVVVNFWATWCIFCVSEMPALQRLADRYGSDITIVGVNVGQSRSTATTFAANEQIAYPIVLDSHADVTETYRVYSMPSTFVLDSDGVIRALRYGTILPSELIDALDSLMSATPEPT